MWLEEAKEHLAEGRTYLVMHDDAPRAYALLERMEAILAKQVACCNVSDCDECAPIHALLRDLEKGPPDDCGYGKEAPNAQDEKG